MIYTCVPLPKFPPLVIEVPKVDRLLPVLMRLPEEVLPPPAKE